MRRAVIGAWGCVLLAAVGGCGRASRDGHSTAAGGSTSSGAGASSGGATQTGGKGSGGATTGSGGATPALGNGYLDEVPSIAADKLDLLFMVDNSFGMGVKQQLLADAIPSLLEQLTSPPCLEQAIPTGDNTRADGTCASGSPAHLPLRDIHIAVVSSSLGAHGGGVCIQDSTDDHAQLLPLVRPDPAHPVETWNDRGFLAWDPDQNRDEPPGSADVAAFEHDFQNLLLSAGATGCGYEASLEAWYRFLVDPEPIISVPTVVDTSAGVQPLYSDDPSSNPVLRQRADFLRPDSVVAIVMLTDENDCSIKDGGQSWLIGSSTLGGASFHMPRSTSACATNPNDPCCTSCAAQPPAGCTAPSEDESCQVNGGKYLASEDNLALRCFDQKRRFGVDFLYPTERYVNGLTQPMVPKQDGTLAPNPLFAGSPPRAPGLVVLAGIVGVPWQDIANPNTLAPDTALRLMSYADLQDQNRWSMILGDDGVNPPTLPEDRLMVETPLDRSSLWPDYAHPLVNWATLTAATETSLINQINGHEWNTVAHDDLQYACIFPLPEAVDCEAMDAPCECDPSNAAENKPICEGTMQKFAKAYPGIRALQVLRDFGAKTQNAVVASICPKSMVPNDASYGYQPAINAIATAIETKLSSNCTRNDVAAARDANAPKGQTSCRMYEAVEAQECDCTSRPGRSALSDELTEALRLELHLRLHCGTSGTPPCEAQCICELQQLSGADGLRCQTEAERPADIYGFCNINPNTASDPALREQQNRLVAECPVDQKSRLRFVGDEVPAPGATVLSQCGGS